MLRRRFGPLLGFRSIAEDFLTNNPLGGLIQIVVECPRDLQILGPQSLLNEGLGCAKDNRRKTLARIAVRSEPISAAKGQEEPAAPAVRQAEVHLDGSFGLFRSSKRRTNAVERGCGGITLACSRRALEQRCDLTQLLAKLLFTGQCCNSRLVRWIEGEQLVSS